MRANVADDPGNLRDRIVDDALFRLGFEKRSTLLVQRAFGLDEYQRPRVLNRSLPLEMIAALPGIRLAGKTRRAGNDRAVELKRVRPGRRTGRVELAEIIVREQRKNRELHRRDRVRRLRALHVAVPIE